MENNYSTTDVSSSGVTSYDDDVRMEALRILMDVLLITLTVLLMLAFGCSLEVSHIRRHLAEPIHVVLGNMLHFVCLPYVFYALEQAVGLEMYGRMALTVLATSPSGGISNLFVYYADGDLALGIIITATSNVLALGFMPLNLWLFSRTWDDGVSLPYIQTIISLVTILIPVGGGMMILRHRPKTAKLVSKISSLVADVMIVATIALSSYMYPQMYTVSWKNWLFAAMFSPFAFAFGYLLTLAMRMPPDVRRTIGINSAVKSMALCLTIIAMTFSTTDYLKYLALPELHSILMLLELTGYVCAYRLYRWCHGKYIVQEDEDGSSTETVDQEVNLFAVSLSAHTISAPSGCVGHIKARNRQIVRRLSDSHLSIPNSECRTRLRRNSSSL